MKLGKYAEYYMNSNMEQLLNALSIDFESPLKLHPKLKNILEEGLVEDEGAILLQAAFDEKARQHKSPPAIEREMFENHVHIDSWYLGDGRTAAFYIAQAFAYIDQLSMLLSTAYEDSTFRIILGIELDKPGYCTVRFYRKRVGENDIVEKAIIEQFKAEAVMIFDL